MLCNVVFFLTSGWHSTESQLKRKSYLWCIVSITWVLRLGSLSGQAQGAQCKPLLFRGSERVKMAFREMWSRSKERSIWADWIPAYRNNLIRKHKSQVMSCLFNAFCKHSKGFEVHHIIMPQDCIGHTLLKIDGCLLQTSFNGGLIAHDLGIQFHHSYLVQGLSE